MTRKEELAEVRRILMKVLTPNVDRVSVMYHSDKRETYERRMIYKVYRGDKFEEEIKRGDKFEEEIKLALAEITHVAKIPGWEYYEGVGYRRGPGTGIRMAGICKHVGR
jgi:hypothetical protein